MCIIAVQPKGIEIEKGYLENCWKNNTNGGGFMFTNGNKVLIYKTLISFNDYYENYKKYKSMFPDSVFIHHFRISTHGKVNIENCHPFKINEQLAFCHNGIFHDVEVNNNYSDTCMFNEKVLKNLPNDFLLNDGILNLLDYYCGFNNKLAFLSSDNKYTIINEISGVWHKGIWYSNNGYSYDRLAYIDYGGSRLMNVPNKKQKTKSNKKVKEYNSMGELLVDENCKYCGSELIYNFEKNRGYCHNCADKGV